MIFDDPSTFLLVFSMFFQCFLRWPRRGLGAQGRVGSDLGGFWGVLGCSRGILGPSWGVLGRAWGVLGGSWSDLGGSWGRLGGSWSPPGASWEGSWGYLGGSWGCLGGSGGRPGESWGGVGAIMGGLGVARGPQDPPGERPGEIGQQRAEDYEATLRGGCPWGGGKGEVNLPQD